MSPPTAFPAACAPAAQPILPDEVLEDIFLLLDYAADLARAYAACSTFRRVVSGRRFLRGYRSLHPPPVLGFLDCSGSRREFHPAQPPRRSAPAARAFAEATDFNFSFLPSDPRCWHVRDVRDGRVLLSRATTTGFFSEDLVVCDPLHGLYVQIPRIPGDLAASTGHCGKEIFEPFLAPAGQEKADPPIQVICNVMLKLTVGTFVFSSVTLEWRYATAFSIKEIEWMKCPLLLTRCYAHNCFFWMGGRYSSKVVLVLDVQEMKFSVLDLPRRSMGRDVTIVEAGEGRLGLFILGGRKLSLYSSKTWRDDSFSAKDWRLGKKTRLLDYGWFISKAETEGHILLRGFPRDQYNHRGFPNDRPDAHYFTVDVKTLLVERLCVLKYESSPDYLYASFPPPLTAPSI